MPEIHSVLDAIHAIPPPGTGYGWFNSSGVAPYDSWPQAVIAMQAAEDDDKARAADYFEAPLDAQLAQQITELLQFATDERSVLHADFGFKNALTDGQTITGVIDWGNAKYGDALYDVAWLDFWRPEQGFAAQFKHHYETQGRVPANFWERISCYQLFIAKNSMMFFAKSEQPEKYQFSKDQAKAILQRQ